MVNAAVEISGDEEQRNLGIIKLVVGLNRNPQSAFLTKLLELGP